MTQRRRVLLGNNQRSTLLNGLAGYWKLNEASGIRADSSGNGNDLTDNNTVTQSVGIINNAAQFADANSEWLSRASSPALQMGDIDFTITCSAYFDSVGAYRPLVSKYTTTIATSEYSLYLNSSSRFAFSVNSATEGTITATTFGAALANTWYYVRAYHDSVSNVIGLVVNGTTQAPVAWTTGLHVAATEFTIGRWVGFSAFMNGRIDDVKIWKRMLTPAENAEDYANWIAGRAL